MRLRRVDDVLLWVPPSYDPEGGPACAGFVAPSSR